MIVCRRRRPDVFFRKSFDAGEKDGESSFSEEFTVMKGTNRLVLTAAIARSVRSLQRRFADRKSRPGVEPSRTSRRVRVSAAKRVVVIGALAAAGMLSSGAASADCNVHTTVRFGGRAGGAIGPTDSFASAAETVIDLTRPAPAAMDVVRIDFSYAGPDPSFSIRFLVVRPIGTRYQVVAQTADLVFPRGLPGGSAYSAQLPSSLHFEAGDFLGTVSRLTGSGQLLATQAGDPGGYGLVRSVLSVGMSVDRDSFDFRSDSGVAAAMEAVANVSCADVPPFALIVPVGDVIGSGQTHFRSDLVLLTYLPCCSGALQVSATLRDRLATPGSVSIVEKDVTGVLASDVFHADSVASLLGLSPPFFGTLTLAVPFSQNSAGENWENVITGNSTISAATTSCSGGQTGSTLPAVGCRGVGRRILLPFHAAANHRLNIGIASAFLPDCGATHPATNVIVRLLEPFRGAEVSIPMPGESTQLGGVTSAGSLISAAIGVTDGVFEVRVTDEATRILAYIATIDDTSQDGAPYYGLIVE